MATMLVRPYVTDGDEGGGDEAHHNYMEEVIADALGDWGMDVGAGAHGGGGF